MKNPMDDLRYGKLDFLKFVGCYFENKENINQWLDSFVTAISAKKLGINELADELLKEALESHEKSKEKGKKGAEAKLAKESLRNLPKKTKEPKPKKEKVIKEFVAPTLDDALAYGKEYHKTNPIFTSLDPVRAWFENRKNADWCNMHGKPVVNWKNDLITWINRGIKNEPRSL